MAHLLGVATGTQAPAAVAGLTEIQDASSSANGVGDQPRGAAAALAAAAAVQATANVTSQSTPAPREAPKPAREQQRPQPQVTQPQVTQTQAAKSEEEQAKPVAEQATPEQRERPAQPEPEEKPSEQQPPHEPEAPAASDAEHHVEGRAGSLAEDSGTSQAAEESAPPAQDVDTGELMERIRREWITLRQSVGERNKVAEIMLTEAQPLGMDGSTLVVGHNTGALANSINSKHNNDDIVAVLTEKLGTGVGVRCVVGTDPKAAGFKAPSRAPQAWSPARPEREPELKAESESEPEAEAEQRPSSEPEPVATAQDRSDTGDTGDDPYAADGNEPAEPTPTSDGSVAGDREAVTPEPAPAPVQYDPWGTTSATAGGAGADTAPGAGSAAAAAAAAAAGAANARGAATRPEGGKPVGPKTGFGGETSFSSGVPLPPEPEDEAPADEEPAPYTREDEERDMVDQSQEEGSFDRRNPTEVAMDLLAEELGARPL